MSNSSFTMLVQSSAEYAHFSSNPTVLGKLPMCCFELFVFITKPISEVGLSARVPSLQVHVDEFLGVFRREHGGADLRVTTAGNLVPA